MESTRNFACFRPFSKFGFMKTHMRRATESDAEAVARVHITSWQSAYRGQLPDRFLDDLSMELESRANFWRGHIATQSSARHEIWTAEVDGSLQGFAAVGPARRDDESGCGEVYALYVDPLRWSQGVGRLLLAHAVQRLFRGYTRAVLWVLESNARARRFYERAGWAVEGGTKIEHLADGTELREVRYHVSCSRENEE